jgi:molybdate-binding protein/DNA-binding transcriptional regulator YhcF (GntR family)
MSNIDIRLQVSSDSPIYQQITEQIRQLIASGHLKQDDRLPSIRQIANLLGINQNTVARAFLTLEQERVIVTRRGGGSVVAGKPDDPAITLARQKRLADIIGDNIIKVLSLGYSPEEAEATFYLQLARWREERQKTEEETGDQAKIISSRNTINIVGSHDLALNILIDLFNKRTNKDTEIKVMNAGSLGGLIALQEERAHLAGIHLLDEETEEYNYPYIKRILPGVEVAVVHLVYRIQGLMFPPGNPKQIKGIADLMRPEIAFVNRQKGAGTRVLLDINLHKLGIPVSKIRGYEREVNTHVAAALTVTRGEADVALGIEAAARSCNLEFLPLFRERYDLVMPRANYRSRLLAPFLNTVVSDEFRAIIDKVGGYDTTETGAVTYL